MNMPIKPKRYIRLVVDEELDKNHTRAWYETVSDYGPKNIHNPIQLTGPDGSPTHTKLIKSKVAGGKYWYDYPLSRDLTEDEAQMIVDAWNDIFDNEYNIETSQPLVYTEYNERIIEPNIKNDDWEAICEQYAKELHNRWYEDKVDQGWRYGMQFNEQEKVHPLLRPWNDLPEDYRTADYESPSKLLEIMDRFGYSVVNKNTFRKLYKE